LATSTNRPDGWTLTNVGPAPPERTVLSSLSFPPSRSTAKALTVPSFPLPTRSVSLPEYRRVPAAFNARQLGLVPVTWTPAGVIAPVARSTRKR
jgi:hypothetical protein